MAWPRCHRIRVGDVLNYERRPAFFAIRSISPRVISRASTEKSAAAAPMATARSFTSFRMAHLVSGYR